MDLEASVKESLQALFQQCGENPQREGLDKTPQRFLKAFQECTQGYHQTVEEVVHGALFPCTNASPVLLEHVPFFSLCEHHLLPFFGHATIAYLPQEKVLGLSKIYRLVNLFSQRLQLQERLTQQIGEALQQVTNAKGVWVELEGEHLCVKMRGVQRTHSPTRTFYASGQAIDFSSLPTTPSSSSENSLVVRTREIPMKIGCYAEEQQKTTPVQITLALKIPKTYGTSSDDLQQTVDYDALMKSIYSTVLQQRFQLLEYASQQVYQTAHQFLKTHHPQVPVRVTLTKKLAHPLLQESQFTMGDF